MSFTVTIVSPKEKWEGRVDSLTLPGERGELTLKTDHAPVFGRLKKGTVLADAYQKEIAGGFFAFIDNLARVAVDEV